MEFSRLSIEGMPVSKRKIKPLIDKGLVYGYDDIRLPTLRGLRKRGIVPDTIKQFVFSQGISKVESKVDFSIIESINRKILDPLVKRYFFVSDPIKLTISKAPKRKLSLSLHPTKNMGKRNIETNSVFFIQKQDLNNMQIGDIFRLKGLYNVKIQEIGKEINAKYESEELIPQSVKIQWTTQNNLKMKIFIPQLLFYNGVFNEKSLVELKGYAEAALSDISDGEIVQFERVGFVRIEKEKGTIVGYFAHK
jgi:glutamyl-tRNA synthetase